MKSLVEAAEQEIENLSTEQAIGLHGNDDVVLVDIRDIRELQRDGKVPGAFHCPRGMLEFWIDPESPYHKPLFAQDKKYVFFCAGGLRSALAAQTAHKMGLKPVAHIRGGFGAWKKAGGAGGRTAREGLRRGASIRALDRRDHFFSLADRADAHALGRSSGSNGRRASDVAQAHSRQQELFVLVAAALDRHASCGDRFRGGGDPAL